MTLDSPPTAIVTGAASGIGLAIARRLIELRYRVAMLDCDAQRLGDAADRLGEKASPIVADVSDAEAWQRVVSQLQDEWPRLDLLVNNAGVLAGGELCGLTIEATQRVLDVNLRGAMLGCQIVGKWLVDSASSAADRRDHNHPLPGVINIASIFAVAAPPGFAAYSASKAGLVALSEALRGELAPHGLNVTVALPGTTPTGLFDRAEFTAANFTQAVGQYQTVSKLSAESVATETLAAAARGRPYAIVGGRAQRVALLKRLFPTAILRRIGEQARRELGLPHRLPGQQNQTTPRPSNQPN